MAQNNNSASVTGAARMAGARHKKRAAALSASSAFQLFLEHRRRSLRNSTSPEVESKIVIPDKYSTPSQSQPPSDCRPFASPLRKPKLGDATHSRAILRHLSKLAPLYRRHRNLERALNLFLLRRQLWRRTRRPFFQMDFIKRLRDIQADESSSDEDSGLVLTSASVSALRHHSPVSEQAAVVAANQPEKTKTAGEKRKRDTAAEGPAEDVGPENLPAAKREEVEPVPPAVGRKLAVPVPNGRDGTPNGRDGTDGNKSTKKRALDEETAGATAEESAAKKVRIVKPVGGAKVEAENRKPAQSESSKAADSAAAAAPRPKPVAKMEYHDQRVHDMLTDPLGFDDFVYDTTKPIPRHLARSFARYRRRQPQSPPPLIMSGAIGPAALAAKSPVTPKLKRPGNSLAKEAQKRAYQQRINERVKDMKEKKAAESESGFPGEQGKGKAVVGRQPPGGLKGGSGKHKEKRWLTAARQGGVNYGEQHGARVKKYKKPV
ncbi:uncharacterized protein P884DRAFT_263383 [Thermothelomyces heterothallicus CBS 202.75]|uniref:uncharacterized protein n=1 Tax=Thermothelomyces heterothallicus CBS 202.75 TaxID=1149848 RepID=UPI003743EC39